MTKKLRCKIGIKVPIFRNAGTFVVYLTEEQTNTMDSLIDELKRELTAAGYKNIADKVVWEVQ